MVGKFVPGSVLNFSISIGAGGLGNEQFKGPLKQTPLEFTPG